MNNPSQDIQHLVKSLGLEPHVEGGYFKQTFKSSDAKIIETDYGKRSTLTSIYYLLTDDSPVGHFHLNRSDIMHYFHAGDPITYHLIHPDGHLESKVLGPDVANGNAYQFVVKGGVWKASELPENSQFGYGLIGEAVAPGFEYQDMQLGKTSQMCRMFPQHAALFEKLSRS